MPENCNPDQENKCADQGLPGASRAIESPSNCNQPHSESCNQSIREWARFALEIVGLIFLICYVRATQRQVGTSKDANRIARAALVSSERPWLGVAEIGELEHYTVDNTPTAQLKVETFGKTPAMQVKIRSGMGTWPQNSFTFEKVVSNRIITEHAVGTIFPNHGAQSTVGIWIPLKSWQVESPTELIIFGLITYKNWLGSIHHTPICEAYEAPTVLYGKEIVPGGFGGSGSCATDTTIPKTD